MQPGSATTNGGWQIFNAIFGWSKSSFSSFPPLTPKLLSPYMQMTNHTPSFFQILVDNTATLGTILSYVFYWILVAATLVYLKWKEGRTSFFGYKSAALQRRHALREARKANEVALQNTEQYQTDEKAYNGNQGSVEGERSSEGKSPVVTPVDERHVPALERHY